MLRRGFWVPAVTNFTTQGSAKKQAGNYGTVVSMNYPTIEDAIGKTPVAALHRIARGRQREARQWCWASWKATTRPAR